MSKKTRKGFTGTVLEALEGRALLSGLAPNLPTFGAHRIHAQVVRQRSHANPQQFVPVGSVGTQYLTAPRTGALGTRHGLKHRVATPQLPPVTPTPVVAPTSTATGTVTPSLPVSGLNLRPDTGRMALAGGGYTTGQGAGPSGSLRLAEPGPAFATSTPAVTSLALNPMPIAPGGMPGDPAGAASAGMVPLGPPTPWMFMGATLNASELAGFKKSVDTFATDYTSGADAAKDTAALTALKSGLGDVALSIWGRQNVATKDAAATFKTAADTFATTYTAGTDPAKDLTAWKSLQSAMNALGGSMTGGNADAWSVGSAPGMYRLTSMPDASMGDTLLGGVTMLGTLGKSDVASLKAAVDTFATAYTSGADTTKDQAAVLALQNSLDTVTSQYWQAHPYKGQDLPMMTRKASAQPGTSTPAPSDSARPAPPSFPPGPGRFTLVRNPSSPPVTTTSTAAPNGLG